MSDSDTAVRSVLPPAPPSSYFLHQKEYCPCGEGYIPQADDSKICDKKRHNIYENDLFILGTKQTLSGQQFMSKQQVSIEEEDVRKLMAENVELENENKRLRKKLERTEGLVECLSRKRRCGACGRES